MRRHRKDAEKQYAPCHKLGEGKLFEEVGEQDDSRGCKKPLSKIVALNVVAKHDAPNKVHCEKREPQHLAVIFPPAFLKEHDRCCEDREQCEGVSEVDLHIDPLTHQKSKRGSVLQAAVDAKREDICGFTCETKPNRTEHTRHGAQQRADCDG